MPGFWTQILLVLNDCNIWVLSAILTAVFAGEYCRSSYAIVEFPAGLSAVQLVLKFEKIIEHQELDEGKSRELPGVAGGVVGGVLAGGVPGLLRSGCCALHWRINIAKHTTRALSFILPGLEEHSGSSQVADGLLSTGSSMIGLP